MAALPLFIPDSPLVGAVRPSPGHGERVRPSPDDGERVRPSPDDGERVRPSPDDGERVRPSPDDGERVRPSPDDGERRGRAGPDSLVLHYTGMADGASALTRLCAPSSEVSCHYLIEEDGTVVQLVPEARRAWHAGRGVWASETDMNSASIGIEIVNGGHDFGLPAFPDRQVHAVAALCRDVMDRHGIGAERVLAHSDLAPARKRDPGEMFPWRVLAQAGVGLWVAPDDAATPALAPGEAGDAVLRLQADLARWGYGIDADGRYGERTATVVRAFQRRYRPSRISGDADAGTLSTLERLMALRFGVGASLIADRAAAPARV